MREIKFRGKRLDNGEWAYGHYLEYGLDKNSQPYIKTRGYQPVKVDTATVGQYTGMLDANGTEIYEGDIVRYFNTVADVHACGVVEWIPGWFWCYYGAGLGNYKIVDDQPDTSGDWDKCEVVTNIYDSPELLNTK